MQNKLLKKLSSIVGDDHLLEKQAQMEGYLSGPEQPVAVVFPGGTEEVSEIIVLCNELDIKLGVGGHTVNTTGLSGGLAMCMSRMNRVLDIDHENLVSEVEAGTPQGLFQHKIAAEGMYFPPEPYKGDDSSIGACIAAGDLDCKAFVYGPPRAYVLGFEMVMPTGKILQCGSKVIKNVAGYDLIHFIVGSRGTLGVITKIMLKLLPLPEVRRTIIGSFSSLAEAGKVTQTLLERQIFPARLNILNAPLAAKLELDPQQIAPGHLVLVDLEGFHNSTAHLSKEIAALFRVENAQDVLILDAQDGIDVFWRKWLVLKQKYHGDVHDRLIDFLVGPAHVPQALARLEELMADIDSRSDLMVYALNGNIRLAPSAANDKESLLIEVNQLALSLGGNIAGGLGYRLKCAELKEDEMWQEMLNLTSDIRGQFDPNSIMAQAVAQ